jgi:hypothetical protein
MRSLFTSAEAAIDASATVVLDILRDFDGHHREILPPAFSNFVVEEGGLGAGTVTRFDFTLGGRTQQTRTRVEEPAPGIIRERVIGRDMVSTFTVTAAGDRALARIETTWQPVGRVSGLLERLFAPRMLRGIYRDELARLERYARTISEGEAPIDDRQVRPAR